MYFVIALVSCLCIHNVYSAANCGPGGNANCALRCQNTSLTSAAPTPTATACVDTRPDCGAIFNCSTDTAPCDDVAAYVAFLATDPATNPKYRAMLCDLDSMQDIAVECARTCQICCETSAYNCLDDDTGVVDCQANINKCTDANWTDIMASYCPATCGLCANGTCRDLNSGCAGLSSLCKNVDFYEYMNTNCARTCDTCTNSSSSTSTTCTNVASNCAANSALCTNSLYATLMAQQCCATCASTSTSTTCVNSNSACANWVSNGFCTSSFYTAAQKRQYCASSCGLC